MNALNILTILIGGTGITGTIVTWYQVRKQASSSAASTEVEAAAQETANWDKFTGRIQEHMDFLEGQIKNLRSEVDSLKDARLYDKEHIRILQRQIYAGIGPPPLRPGDTWPDDQMGG